MCPRLTGRIILLKLPEAKVKHPERMLEFVQWIAAMELAMGIPQGDLQAMYSDNLRESQQHGLMENALGAAVIECAASDHMVPNDLIH